MKLLYGLAGIAILVSALPPLSTHAQGSSGILISEINWAGSEKSQADEWIELINTNDAAMDISGWLLVGAATGGDAIALPDATILGARETLLIANYQNGDSKSTLASEPNLVTTALSLANSSLHVFLTDQHGLVHDSYEDTGTPDFGSTSPITSIERIIATKAWQSSVITLGLTLETQFGTPGYATIETDVVNTENTPQNAIPSTEIDDLEPTDENSVETEENYTNISDEIPYELVEIIEEELLVETTEPTVVDTDGIQNIVAHNDPEETTETLTDVVETLAQQVSENVEQEQSSSPEVMTKRIVKSGEVRINEILSAPSSGDEWIEIYNITSETFTLDNWTLTDASGKVTMLSGDLAGDQYLIVKNPAGKLNNDGDELTMKNEYADVIDTLTYGTDDLAAPGKDQSLIYTTKGWLTGIPSPNEANPEPVIEQVTEQPSSTNEPIYAQDNITNPVEMDSDASATQLAEPQPTPTPDATNGIRRVIAIAQPVTEPTEEQMPAKKTSGTSKAPPEEQPIVQITITEFANALHGDKVSVAGTVIMEPMKVAKQVMYLEGLEIYFHAADWPKIPIGSSVTLTGTVDHESTNSRIKIASTDSIIVNDAMVDVLPTTISTTDLSAVGSGRLVTITGDVSLVTKTGFTLKTEAGDIAINLKAASDITSSKLSTGAVTVTGVLIKNKAGAYEIYPRSSEDLKQDTATKTVPSSTAILGTIAPSKNALPATTAGLSLGAIALGLISYWLLKTKPELLTSLTSHLETYVR